jgi:hypothetical protein
MFVLLIPGIDRAVALAGAMPIQTTLAIATVMNKTMRIDWTSLKLYSGCSNRVRQCTLSDRLPRGWLHA